MAADDRIVLYCHLDIVGRHRAGGALSCVTGWIAAEAGHEVLSLALDLGDGRYVACGYPFHRGDLVPAIKLAGTAAMCGFNVVLPKSLGAGPRELAFVAEVRSGLPRPPADPPATGHGHYRFVMTAAAGQSREVRLAQAEGLPFAPVLLGRDDAAVGEILESRLFDQLARERQLTLRLDLINKCNLRCVMCHYSDEAFARRPVQRITTEQFSAWFDPLAPLTREVVLSCGDEPLMSPHFEAILGQLAARDPEVKIQFCTNAMLLTERIAQAIVAARVELVMLSFDGVSPSTLHRIRAGSDYRRIVKNILGLKRERAKSGRSGPRFVFNFVMLESNIHEAPLFVPLARRLGGDGIDFRHVVQYGLYDIEGEMLENYKPKYNYYRERIAAAAAAAGMEIYIPPPFSTPARHDPSQDPPVSLEAFEAELRALGNDAIDAVSEVAVDLRATVVRPPTHVHESAHFFCDRPFSEVMIREQRDVYPCPWHREKMGTLDGTTNLQEIFLGESFRRIRLAMLDPDGAPGCAGCPIKANRLPTRQLSAVRSPVTEDSSGL